MISTATKNAGQPESLHLILRFVLPSQATLVHVTQLTSGESGQNAIIRFSYSHPTHNNKNNNNNNNNTISQICLR